MLVEIDYKTIQQLQDLFGREGLRDVVEYIEETNDRMLNIVKIDESSRYPTVDDFFDVLDDYNIDYRIVWVN